MLINKITTGFVIQTFDTVQMRFVAQEFVAGNDCAYERAELAGRPVSSKLLEVDGEEVYLPYDMKQPEEAK